MAKKSSVYFAPPLAALTAQPVRGDLTDSVSGRINRCAERYMEIIRLHALTLNDSERQVLGDVLSGTWADPLLIRHLADEVADSDAARDGDPAATSLEALLRAASFADLVATVEAAGF